MPEPGPDPVRGPEDDARVTPGPIPEPADPAPPSAGTPAEPAALGDPAAPDVPAAPAAPAVLGEPAAPAAPTPGDAPAAAAGAARVAPEPGPPAAPAPRAPGPLAERPEVPVELPRRAVAARTRRDFLLFGLGTAAAVLGAWWVLPFATRSRLLPGAGRARLDALAARLGLTPQRRERVLDRALRFDDDVAEALSSKDRMVRTYDRGDVTPLRNNYNGQTPGPEYLATWSLSLSGLASGRIERFTSAELEARFPAREQVTRLVCVEGWSAVAWWGGFRFADLLAAYPPAPGARWAALRSAVNLDTAGRPDPYYVSIDLETARHPQTLLATRQGGRPLTLAHGAPLRLLVPVKLGLKNIKAVTEIAYGASEPPDYWSERGYSRYDGL